MLEQAPAGSLALIISCRNLKNLSWIAPFMCSTEQEKFDSPHTDFYNEISKTKGDKIIQIWKPQNKSGK